MTDNHALFLAALRNRYTHASFTTLDKHLARGQFSERAALKLLRNNVRDVAPRATIDIQQRIARRLLQHWRVLATPDSPNATE